MDGIKRLDTAEGNFSQLRIQWKRKPTHCSIGLRLNKQRLSIIRNNTERADIHVIQRQRRKYHNFKNNDWARDIAHWHTTCLASASEVMSSIPGTKKK